LKNGVYTAYPPQGNGLVRELFSLYECFRFNTLSGYVDRQGSKLGFKKRRNGVRVKGQSKLTSDEGESGIPSVLGINELIDVLNFTSDLRYSRASTN
jgi:hypothetical protein